MRNGGATGAHIADTAWLPMLRAAFERLAPLVNEFEAEMTSHA